MTAQDLALFRRFPALAQTLARQPFIDGPTPIAPFPLKGAPEGVVFVKRDDLSCPLYGGNKPRKLEFVIGEALRRSSSRLVTSGGLGTNHGLATAILGRSVGLETTLVLVHQPVTAAVARSLEHCCAWGAEVVYGRTTPGAVAASARVLARSALRGERPFLVWTGGSSTRGALGFVSAALELAQQVSEGDMPEPAEIWLPVGTGGTLVGLLVGLKLAGLSTRVRGAVVTDILTPTPKGLARHARAVVRLLRRSDPGIPKLEVSAADFLLDASQLGAGYGSETDSAREALAAARNSGIELETTYTAKCLAALLAHSRKSSALAGPVLFWNTFNGSQVSTPPPQLAASALPSTVQRLLEASR
jgi:D-cysteine desulfhydrase